MQEHFPFLRDDILPSFFVNALEKFLSTYATNVALVKASSTTVRVQASANDGAAVLAIAGKWRWNEATVTRAHPGGAAGVYTVWAVAKNNNIVNTPDPNTDITDYSWDLRIIAGSTPPTIVAGTVDIYRQIGTLSWTGTAIDWVLPTFDLTPPQPHGRSHEPDGIDALSPSNLVGAGPLPPAGKDNLGVQYWHTGVFVMYQCQSAGGGSYVWTPLFATPQLVTSLPGSPVDGQEIYYVANAATGAVWHFRYRAASTSPYKWEYVGGSPEYDQSADGAQFTTASTTGTNDLAVTVDFDGDYIVEFGAQVQNQSGNGFIVRATNAGSGDSPGIEGDNSNTTKYLPAFGKEHLLDVNAGLVHLRLQSVGGGTIVAYGRSINVTPIRVG